MIWVVAVTSSAALLWWLTLAARSLCRGISVLYLAVCDMGRFGRLIYHLIFKAGKYHEQIRIENNSTGHSYERLFGRFLDPTLTGVVVEDPYIRSTHQVYNTSFEKCKIWNSRNSFIWILFIINPRRRDSPPPSSDVCPSARP